VELNLFDANIRFNTAANAVQSQIQTRVSEKPSSRGLLQTLIDWCREGLCGSELKKTVSEPCLRSQILVLGGLNWHNFTIKEISSLFSNYGNIHFGMSFKTSDVLLIMYTTSAGAQLGLQYLKSLNLRGKRANIVLLSNFDGLDPCHLEAPPSIYVPPFANRRFKQEVPNQANAISSTLHVCVFYPGKRRVVTNSEMTDHFKSFGVIPQQLRRDPNPDHSNMWFIDFKNNSEAVICLMRAHDSPFEDGNVRISFTKSKKPAFIRRTD